MGLATERVGQCTQARHRDQDALRAARWTNPWMVYHAALRAVGYDGWFTVELEVRDRESALRYARDSYPDTQDLLTWNAARES